MARFEGSTSTWRLDGVGVIAEHGRRFDAEAGRAPGLAAHQGERRALGAAGGVEDPDEARSSRRLDRQLGRARCAGWRGRAAQARARQGQPGEILDLEFSGPVE